jgi:hypothetical protein
MDVEQFANPVWPKRTPGLRRRFARTLIRDLVILVVVLAAGEAAVRVLFPSYSCYIFTKSLTGGHPQLMNSWGIRDREFPRQCPPGETRLLCLGNSTTRGAGVASHHTYPKQLEAQLNDRGAGNHYLVINASGEGRSLYHALEFLKNDGVDMGPEVVVLGFSPSMLAVLAQEHAALSEQAAAEAAGDDNPQPSLKRRLSETATSVVVSLKLARRYSYLNAFIDSNIRKALYRARVLRDPMNSRVGAIFSYAFDVPGVDIDQVETAYDLAAARLADMKNVLDEQGVHLMVLGIPSRWEISEHHEDNRRHFELGKIRISPLDRAAEYCRELGVPFVDLRPRLRKERLAMLEGNKPWDDLYIPLDYSHLDPAGLGIAAEMLLGEIERQGWLRQAD